MLPIDATHEEREQLREQLGFNSPIWTQYANYMRNSFKGQFGESIKYPDYEAMGLVLTRFPTTIKLARTKGLRESKVVWKHAVRNAAIAPLTYFGIIFGGLLVGSVSAETVFNCKGIGLLAFEAVLARDFPLMQAIVVFFAGIYVLTNLVIDVLYAYLDPRIRYS